MKCTTCSYETQSGAKFCVQCGTTLPTAGAGAGAATAAPATPASAPGPGSAVKSTLPGTDSSTGMRSGVGAPPSPASTTGIRAAAPSASSTMSRPATPVSTSPASAGTTMSRPAIPPLGAPPTATPPPATSGNRVGMVVGAIVGGVAVLGICGYLGYRMLFGGESPNRIATSEPPPAIVAAPTAVPELPKDSAPAPQGSSQDTAPAQSTAIPPDSEAKPLTTDSAKNATSTGTDPTKASATKDASKAPGTTVASKDSSKDSTKDSSKAPPVVPGASPSTTDASKAGSPAAQQTAQVDRWKLMKDAMSRCGGETFFKRVACEQAVGLQYCEGYWGRVPQCPSGPPKDHGQ